MSTSIRRRHSVKEDVDAMETINEDSDTEKQKKRAVNVTDESRNTDKKSKQKKATVRKTQAVEEEPVEGSYRPWIFMIFFVGMSLYTFVYDPRWKYYVSRFMGMTGSNLAPTSKEWWSRALIYQIYPRSFYDSDGDGVGDLQGITQKLQYLQYLGVDAICLSPIYKSPMLNHGYDVSSFKEVDPVIGNKEDLQKLILEAHRRQIRVILDFIPNHTSDQHSWFRESRRGGATNPYSDYYVWHDGSLQADGTRTPPNNWASVRNGSMWQWDAKRMQYYLHQFSSNEPDLNFRNVRVQEEIVNSMGIWLELGVDGFRFMYVRHLYETQNKGRLETKANTLNSAPDQYDYYSHTHTTDQPEVKTLLLQWRKLFDQFEAKKNTKLVLMADVRGRNIRKALTYYDSGANLPINYNLQLVNSSCDGVCMARLVSQWISRLSEEQYPNWMTGSPDIGRVASRVGEEYVNILNAITLLLPGVSLTYYGEELGMKDVRDIRGVDKQTSVSRQSVSPMQWSDDKYAGFSAYTDLDSFNDIERPEPWLPVHREYETDCVAVEGLDKDSNLEFYRRIVQLRHDSAIRKADFDLAIINEHIFSFVRYANGQSAYLFTVNLSNETTTDNYRKYSGKFPPEGKFIPRDGAVVLNTLPRDRRTHQPEDRLDLGRLSLAPKEGLLVRFWPGY